MLQTPDFIVLLQRKAEAFSDNAYTSKLFGVTGIDEHTGALKPLYLHSMQFSGCTLGKALSRLHNRKHPHTAFEAVQVTSLSSGSPFGCRVCFPCSCSPLSGFISSKKNTDLNQWAARHDCGLKERKALIVSACSLELLLGAEVC